MPRKPSIKKKDYYEIMYDLKKVDLLKKTNCLVDRITIERGLTIIFKCILNLLNDFFDKVKNEYGFDADLYYDFLKDFKKQVNTILRESGLNIEVEENGKEKI